MKNFNYETEYIEPTVRIIRGKYYISYTQTHTAKIIARGIMPAYTTDFKRPDGSRKTVFVFETDENLLAALTEIYGCEVRWDNSFVDKQR